MKNGNGVNGKKRSFSYRDFLVGAGGFSLGAALLQSQLIQTFFVEMARNSGDTIVISASLLAGGYFAVGAGVRAIDKIGDKVDVMGEAAMQQAAAMVEQSAAVQKIADAGNAEIRAMKIEVGFLAHNSEETLKIVREIKETRT